MVQISIGFLGCLLFFPSVSLLGGFNILCLFISILSSAFPQQINLVGVLIKEVKTEYVTGQVAAHRHANILILCFSCWS